jgi:hypothetical protein
MRTIAPLGVRAPIVMLDVSSKLLDQAEADRGNVLLCAGARRSACSLRPGVRA